jgi:hypothetical protein
MPLRSAFAAMLRIIALMGGSWVVPHPAVASADDAAADFLLAQRYEHADGVSRDYGHALKLYCLAASQGHADATFGIAWIYLNGRGVARDDTNGAAWLRVAADRGHQLARRLLERLGNVPVVTPTGCGETPPMKSAGAALPSKKIARVAPVPTPSDKSADLDQYPSMPGHLLTAGLRGTELYKLVGPSVYFIEAGNNKVGMASLGSAVAVSNTTLITNCHVVKNSDYILVKKEEQFGTARVVGGDKKTDRCFLQTTDMPLTPVQGVRPFQSIEVGEDVYALGNPRGLESTFSPGIVSAKRHQDGLNYVQTTAPITNGSSGGGLFDSRGNLIGINTFLIKGVGNLNFAISADEFWRLPSAGAAAPSKEIARLVAENAAANGIDPKLVFAVIATESVFPTEAVSPPNAGGLMHLRPEAAERFGVKNVFDTRENIRGGTKYLRWLLTYFDGDLLLVLAAYNAGEEAVVRYGGIPPFPETRVYVEQIRARYTPAPRADHGVP